MYAARHVTRRSLYRRRERKIDDMKENGALYTVLVWIGVVIVLAFPLATTATLIWIAVNSDRYLGAGR